MYCWRLRPRSRLRAVGILSPPFPSSLLLLGYEGTSPPDELCARIAAGRVGGVILFARNVGSIDEVAESVERLGRSSLSAPPLIVSVDQEGGRVQRLREPLTRWPPMLRVAEANDPALTESVGRALGDELRLVGFNLDFAPVLDVNSNPANPVIGDRAFGAAAEAVSCHALAFWRGLEAAGVRGCGKHFPGHGDTSQDSHLELPRVEAPWQRLEACELAPFTQAIRAGLSMIMTAHVVYPAMDHRPATLSPRWLNEILRKRLGFVGVVVSDDLDMKAVAAHFSVEETIHGGLAAGVDLFLACRDPARQAAAEEALERAARDVALAPRVADALRRVERFRASLAPASPAPKAVRYAALPDWTHQALARRCRPSPV